MFFHTLSQDRQVRMSRRVSKSSDCWCVHGDASHETFPDGTGGRRFGVSDDLWPQPVMLPTQLDGGILEGRVLGLADVTRILLSNRAVRRIWDRFLIV